jgi:hypothetical protein
MGVYERPLLIDVVICNLCHSSPPPFNALQWKLETYN